MRSSVVDIDGTLIAWRRTRPAAHVVIDRAAGQVATLGRREHALLRGLAHGGQLMFASMRSIEQFQRLEWTLACQEFVILDAGGTILRDGSTESVWSEWVKEVSLMNRRDGGRIWQAIEPLLPSQAVRRAITKPAYARVRLTQPLTPQVAATVIAVATSEGYTIELTERQLVASVPEVGKAAALAYLVEHHGVQVAAAAGDSELDHEFVRMAKLKLAPNGSDLARLCDPEIRAVPQTEIPWRLCLGV